MPGDRGVGRGWWRGGRRVAASAWRGRSPRTPLVVPRHPRAACVPCPHRRRPRGAALPPARLPPVDLGAPARSSACSALPIRPARADTRDGSPRRAQALESCCRLADETATVDATPKPPPPPPEMLPPMLGGGPQCLICYRPQSSLSLLLVRGILWPCAGMAPRGSSSGGIGPSPQPPSPPLLLHASCFVLLASCFLLHASCFLLHASRFTLLASCFLLLASCFLLLASCFYLLASCFLLRASCFLLLASCFLLLASCFMLIAPCFLLHASCFMFLASCFLLLASCLMLDASRFTLHASCFLLAACHVCVFRLASVASCFIVPSVLLLVLRLRVCCYTACALLL